MTDLEEYGLGESRTGTKTHLVDFDAPPSVLVLGSDEYDEDTHARAVCGTISDFDPVDEAPGKSSICYSCVRTAYSRGLIDDPSPFDADRLSHRKRTPRDDDLRDNPVGK